MAAIMLGAASLAYRKAAAKIRDETKNPDTPPWLAQFASHLLEDNSENAPVDLVEPTYHKKERLFSKSSNIYERLAWIVYTRVTNTTWFEVFIMINILMIGIATGVDLENEERDPYKVMFTDITSQITLTIFTIEVVLKVIAEGTEPWQYFTDHENGNFNIFDFLVVVLSYAFVGSAGSTISALRMLRLIRLLAFVKNVPQLRMILAGLVQGLKSVSYIVILLFLVLYIYAILGCILFGDNDPVHFGTIGVGMVSLFQVSTLASWTSVAYVSWFGCEDYLGSPYSDANQRHVDTMTGTFYGFRCIENTPQPTLTGLFFASYILLTAWVIMSIFIGVISMGMFESYLALKEDSHQTAYIERLAENTMPEAQAEQVFLKTGKTTLKDKIEVCLDSEAHLKAPSKYPKYEKFVEKCILIRDSNYFLILITFTIILVGVISGADTNFTLHCNRLESYDNDDDDGDTNHKLQQRVDDCRTTPLYINIVIIFAQIIFTIECLIKISAEGSKPWKYFTTEEDGSWNCLDFLIVAVGFIELTPAQFLFKNFPVVILRLIRLLRVFRLAKALPRLRAIVEALISGFSSVGWICVLIIVFNYIVGCLCVLFFRENDPFHFGSVGRSMFTILRIETLDAWDQVLSITVYGCEGYPSGYEFLQNYPNSTCDNSKGSGYFGIAVLFFIALVGAYVLPTVLVGIVSIKFDKTSKFLDLVRAEHKEVEVHLKKAKELLPDFFTAEKVEAIEDLFYTLDSNLEKTLDLNEITPFFQYALDYLFDVEITPQQCESLFYLLDSNHSTEVGLGEFISLISIIKQMQVKCLEDPNYATRAFAHHIDFISTNTKGKSKWDAAMDRVDADSLTNAWDAVMKSIQGTPGKDLSDKISNLFKDMDTDKSGELDSSEIGAGLKACGIRLNERQLLALIHSIDHDYNGTVSFIEFVKKVTIVMNDREEMRKLNAARELKALLRRNHSKSKLSHHIPKSSYGDLNQIEELRDQFSPNPTASISSSFSSSGNPDNDDDWNDVKVMNGDEAKDEHFNNIEQISTKKFNNSNNSNKNSNHENNKKLLNRSSSLKISPLIKLSQKALINKIERLEKMNDELTLANEALLYKYEPQELKKRQQKMRGSSFPEQPNKNYLLKMHASMGSFVEKVNSENSRSKSDIITNFDIESNKSLGSAL